MATATKDKTETAPAAGTEPTAPAVPPRKEGAELLAYVEDNIQLSKAALAKGAGYFRYLPKEDAPGEFRTQVNVEAFYDALISAQGINLRKRPSVGKSAAYQTSVHGNGVALVGRNYMEELGWYPGDSLNIVVDKEAGTLTLNVASRGPGVPAPEPKKKEKGATTKAAAKPATDGSQL